MAFLKELESNHLNSVAIVQILDIPYSATAALVEYGDDTSCSSYTACNIFCLPLISLACQEGMSIFSEGCDGKNN